MNIQNKIVRRRCFLQIKSYHVLSTLDKIKEKNITNHEKISKQKRKYFDSHAMVKILHWTFG